MKSLILFLSDFAPQERKDEKIKETKETKKSQKAKKRNDNKIKLSKIVLVLSIIVIIILLYNVIKNNIINSDTDNKKIIGETSYIEIQVHNSILNDASYTEPLAIYDREIIDGLIDKINDSEKINVEDNSMNFENCTIVTFHLTDGKSKKVVAGEFDEYGTIFYTTTKEDSSDKTLYKLNSTTRLDAYIENIYNKESLPESIATERENAISEIKKCLLDSNWLSKNAHINIGKAGEQIESSDKQTYTFKVVNIVDDVMPAIVLQAYSEKYKTYQTFIVRYQNGNVTASTAGLMATGYDESYTCMASDNNVALIYRYLGDWSFEVYEVLYNSLANVETNMEATIEEETTEMVTDDGEFGVIEEDVNSEDDTNTEEVNETGTNEELTIDTEGITYEELDKIISKYDLQEITIELNNSNLDEYLK